MLLTLTPEQRTVVAGGLSLAACSGMTLASHLHVRWLDARGVRALSAQVVTLGSIVVLATALLGPSWALPTWPAAPAWGRSAAVQAGAVALLAAAVAVLTMRLDEVIARSVGARGPAAEPLRRQPVEGAQRVRPAGLGAGRATALVSNRTAGSASWTPTAKDVALRVGLGWLLASAVVEECAFRGVALHQALGLGGWRAVLAVAGVVLAFALSHLFFGWSQALAKLPLSILATASVLVTGTVLAAVIGHAVFNLHVWRRQPAAVLTRERVR